MFIDADKKKYQDYLVDMLGFCDLNHLLESTPSNGVSDQGKENIPRRNCLLRKNALILVDNTLWKGLVLGEVSIFIYSVMLTVVSLYILSSILIGRLLVSYDSIPSKLLKLALDHLYITAPQDSDLEDQAPDPALYGNPKRMLTLAKTMHGFNTFINEQKHLFDVIVLPLRDGLTIIRYKE